MRTPLLRFVIVGLAFMLAAESANAAHTTFALLHSLFDPGTNAQVGAQQGYSVALDGNIAVVGLPYANVGWSGSGVVKVYEAATGAHLRTIVNPTANNNEYFGTAVAISGMLIAVGAPGDYTRVSTFGTVQLFDLANATPDVPVLTLTNHMQPNAMDDFGAAVAISGTRVVVGVPLADPTANLLNAGRAFVYDLSNPTPTVPVLSLSTPTPVSDGNFGISTAISGTRVVVGAKMDGPSFQWRAFVYDLASATPGIPVATLSKPATSPISSGASVAVSGTRIAVGAPNENSGVQYFVGRAYVYDMASATPTTPVFSFTNPSPAQADNFGNAVAISDARIVVGSYQDDSGATNAGVAYVYELTSPTPALPVITLTNPIPALGDFFGGSVAISGARVAVAAPQDDAGATNAGSVYLYDLTVATPTSPVATLNSPSPATGDWFGFRMAASGTRLLVGAVSDDTGATDAGSAYVFDLGSSTPRLPVLTLTNPTPQAGELFGSPVAISDTWAVIGTTRDSTTASNAGIAYVYRLDGTTPAIPEFTLTNPAPIAGDSFGAGVAITGNRVVIGASGNDFGASNAGSVYVYDLAGATPGLPVLTIRNPSPAADDSFGVLIRASGNRVVACATSDDTGAINTGSVYVYDLASATPHLPTLTLTNPSPAAEDHFGVGIAISGDRIVTGVYQKERAYVFDLSSATPTVPVLTLTNPIAMGFGWFGSDVAIEGTLIVIGAWVDGTMQPAAGIAYVYDLASTVPAVPVATLRNPNPDRNDWFGYAVAITGTTAIVGAYGDNTPSTDRGAAYVFGLLPALTIAPASPGLATVSWAPTNAPGFLLQYSDSLAPTNWLNAPSGATNPITIPTSDGTRFFRVAQP